MDHLTLYVGDDIALRDEILILFREQLEKWLNILEVDLSDNNWKNAAHALKGSARGVGVWSIGDLCFQAESAVGDVADKHELRQDLLNRINNEAKLVFKELDVLLEEIAA